MNKQVDYKFFYQKPKLKFGEILNANKITPRDINKDLMVYTQKISEVRTLSKSYPFKPPTIYGFKSPLNIQKY
jgi:hypothetical protein